MIIDFFIVNLIFDVTLITYCSKNVIKLVFKIFHMSIKSTLSKHLEEREQLHSLRKLKLAAQNSVDFSSNDYLGIAQMNFLDTIQRVGLANGTGGSRLLSGNKLYHQELEKNLSTYFNAEAFLLYNSGYTANLGLLSCVPQKGDAILLDEYAHICMKEGARLSRAQHFNFRHNDLKDLEKKLQRIEAKHIFVVVESVYSMDGDQSPLVELVALTEKYNAYLIVDEAHTTGLMPENGNGLCNALGIADKVFARVYTFGKAIGAHGAGIAGEQYLISYLINYSRSFIYTTSLPAHSIAVIREAITYRKGKSDLWSVLLNKIQLFKKNLDTQIPKLESDHPIQGILCGSTNEAILLANYLNNKGMDVRPIASPTVPKTKERIRICLHIYNTDEEIISLCQAINEYYRR